MRSLTFNTPLLVSVAAIAAAGLVGLAQLPALAGALFIGSPGEDPTVEKLQQYLEAGEAERATYTARFDGRSFFYKPRPIVTAGPPPPARTETVAPQPRSEPLTPTVYGGPSITYVFGDAVGFHDSSVPLRVGEERSGVKVVATNPPWSVTVGWRGGTYEVDVFKRTSIGFQPETGAPATAAVATPVAGGGFVPEPKTGG